MTTLITALAGIDRHVCGAITALQQARAEFRRADIGAVPAGRLRNLRKPDRAGKPALVGGRAEAVALVDERTAKSRV